MTDNEDLNQRIGQLEKQLAASAIGNTHSALNDSNSTFYEIDLIKICRIFWVEKFMVAAIVVMCVAASAFYALSIPNMYKSQIVLAPPHEDSKGVVGGGAFPYGGLAAMAGIKLGGGDGGRINQSLKLLESWPFLEVFIQKYDLKPLILAVDGWDKESDALIYDYDLYNPDTKKWVHNGDGGNAVEPSDFTAYKAFSEMLSVSLDESTGMVTIAIEYYSPRLAFKWAELLGQELNRFYQKQDMLKVQKNIDYLTKKIGETNISDMQSIFYEMIESQMQKLMMAEVSEQYLLETIIPGKIPEQKSKPRRAIICFLGAGLGVIFSMLHVLGRYFVEEKVW